MSLADGPIRIGIVGLQHLHTRLYASLFQSISDIVPAAVCESDAALRLPFCDEFSVPGYESLDQMLRDEELDAAALFLPHADFPAAAVRCAETGLHLMIDKPMAATAEGAQRIVAAAEKHGLCHTTGFYFRLHPVAAELRRLVQSGSIGTVVSGQARWITGRTHRYPDGHSAWMLDRARSGGGPLHNVGVHWIDMLRFVLGDEVIAVSGRTSALDAQYSIEDVCAAQLEFSRGALVSLQTGYLLDAAANRHPALEFALVGTRGMLCWEPSMGGGTNRLAVVSDAPDLPSGSREIDLPGNGYVTMCTQYITAFAAAIRRGEPMFVTGRDGWAALRVVEAVYRSAETRRWEEPR